MNRCFPSVLCLHLGLLMLCPVGREAETSSEQLHPFYPSTEGLSTFGRVRNESLSEAASEVEISPENVNHICRLDLKSPPQPASRSYQLPSWGPVNSLISTIMMSIMIH
ncbi:hypothetical protein lerEdw1_001001 [Lerista edwardsae]|nr:hypothetical protein lerEdw1_001001 [Lerista edwardsae]